MAAGGAGMRLFRMIVSVFVMLIAGLIGFFVGIRIDEAMGGAILFSLIAGIACVIYTIENQENEKERNNSPWSVLSEGCCYFTLHIHIF